MSSNGEASALHQSSTSSPMIAITLGFGLTPVLKLGPCFTINAPVDSAFPYSLVASQVYFAVSAKVTCLINKFPLSKMMYFPPELIKSPFFLQLNWGWGAPSGLQCNVTLPFSAAYVFSSTGFFANVGLNAKTLSCPEEYLVSNSL